MIPSNIGNLSNLLTLDLGYNGVDANGIEWLWGLPKLEYLNMNNANLSRATNWAKVITSLPSLLELHFSGCSLDFMSLNVVNLRPFPTAINATKLQYIDLTNNRFNASIPDWLYFCKDLEFLSLSFNQFLGKIFDSVGNLTSLKSLDLRYNLFNSISEDIGNLTSLKSLDLSNNKHFGKLPREITSLCRIQTLDLSSNEFNETEDFSRNMSGCFSGSLEELGLSYNQLSGNLIEQVGEFKSLWYLNLASNSLSGVIPGSLGNLFKSLEYLDLSSNSLLGAIPGSLGNLSKSLGYLDLSSNSLSGAIPGSLGNLLCLEVLRLDHNNFTDNIPNSLGQLSNLQEFRIGNNKLEGIVTESHFVNLSKLVTFSASGNHLTLDVGQDWAPPFQLETLQLGSWRLGIGSEIPSWLQTQTNIMALDLSNTGISGSIPHWFLDIPYLNVSHNNLHGKLPHAIWHVEYLYMSYNNFIGPLPRIGDFVSDLDLSHNSFSEGISGLFCDTTNETYGLQLLNLEGNRLSGELPDCWEKWPSLRLLKLGNNTLSGSIPNSIWSMQSLISLSLYGNKLSGHIPAFTRQTNTKLLKIDLSHNNLDGNLPTWMGASLLNLKILILRSNNLSGVISSEICLLQSLQILDLSNNRFSGIIPRCVSNFTGMATQRVLRLDYTYGSRSYSFNGYDLVAQDIVESASVVTKGVELEYGTTLSLVTNIDFSMNNLSGEIPKELTSLVELRSLNLSGNHLTGWIPESIGDMKQLESLDFSQNSLSGQIPNGFRLLYSLNYLNLSFNKLRGRIPESTQLQSLEASSFIGNDLCGPPLSNCSSGGDGPDQREEKEVDDEKSEIQWLYVLLSLGYAVGFSGVCTALVLKKSWRDAYLECWNARGTRFTCISM